METRNSNCPPLTNSSSDASSPTQHISARTVALGRTHRQSCSSSENNVGNRALCVVGLHRSGDAIALFLQDWEVAKVASSCRTALDMLCQGLHDVERRRGQGDRGEDGLVKVAPVQFQFSFLLSVGLL